MDFVSSRTRRAPRRNHNYSMAYKIRSDTYNYVPGREKPHRLSRSKIDLFVECPRCFYLDQRLGIARPSMPGFTLNIAVDALFKKEFDAHRANGTPHPLMEAYGIEAVPLQHPDIELWRDALRGGIEYLHPETGISFRGGIDDVWQAKDGTLIIVDYKATAGKDEVTLDDKWKEGYKRQMEIYQWLFRQNGFTVSDTGYFVYANGRSDEKAFDGKLEFDVTLLPYTGSTEWIPDTLLALKKALDSDEVPHKGKECEYCAYREAAGKVMVEKFRDGKAKK